MPALRMVDDDGRAAKPFGKSACHLTPYGGPVLICLESCGLSHCLQIVVSHALESRGAVAAQNPKDIGAVFQPELIKLMKAVLDDAVATLPESKRTSTTMAEMASQILACAANGERNPATLKIAALLAVVERSHYSHDISPERRAV